jgi:hypothetical protein
MKRGVEDFLHLRLKVLHHRRKTPVSMEQSLRVALIIHRAPEGESESDSKRA